MKTTPFKHQSQCLDVMTGQHAFAVLLEQGLGKTKILLDDAEHLYRTKEINGLLVIAPNGVHLNWVLREIPTHLDDRVPREIIAWSSRLGTGTKKFATQWESLLKFKGLAIFVVNIEALSFGENAIQRCQEFLHKRRCCMVVDESSRIKTPGSRRTKRIILLGRNALYRRIATGTPVTQSPFDVYTQFRFLDPTILGFQSYYAFKNNFGIFHKRAASANGRAWMFEELVKYVRLDQLTALIADHSFRRTKAECLDLPLKIYKRVTLQMTTEQLKLYKTIEREGIIEFDDFALLAPLAITRLLRCQQITGGFLPTTDESKSSSPIPGDNPKLDTLIELLTEDYTGKTIIWARFRAEIEAIVAKLKIVFGQNSVVEFHGGITGSMRTKAVDAFQTDPNVRFIVGQQQSGIGVTLTEAECVFYFSNTFSYEQRYQSEDRAHRIGTYHPIIYIDLEMADTVDERVRDVLEKSGRIASIVTGDKERNAHGTNKERKEPR